VPPTTAIGDNLISRHKHMLEGYPQASFLCLKVSSQNGGQITAEPGVG